MVRRSYAWNACRRLARQQYTLLCACADAETAYGWLR